MSLVRTAAFLGLAAGAGVAAYVRLAASDPDEWHICVADAPDPGISGAKVLSEPFEEGAEALLIRFNQVAEAEGAELLAGTPQEGRVTWIARSSVFGFPDYVTAEAVAQGDETRLHVLSRLRYGKSDLGVNRRRVEDWLGKMRQSS